MTLEGIFGVPVDVSSTYIILFTIYGAFLEFSGAGKFFIDFSLAVMGGKPSSAGRAVVASSFLLGGPSGSGVATTVMIGTVEWPMLKKAGFEPNAGGGLLAAGGLGAIISPPVLGAAAFLIAEFLKISYLDVIWMATIPTCLYYLSLLFMVELDAMRFGAQEVVFKQEMTIWGMTKRYGFHFVSLIAVVIFMVIGFIFLGVATPTEAAATGTLGSFILALLYRRLNWDVLKKSVMGTVKVTVMIFMIIIVSSTYGEILAFTGAAAGMTGFITSLTISPLVIIIGMLLVVLLLGCFMETVAIMMIIIPIFMPVVNHFGYNLIWFGVMMLIALETGLITPPFGVTLFVMKGVAPSDVTMSDIWKAVTPYVIIDILCIALIMAFPVIATVVPNLMGMVK